ncbi:uncharacterized protein LOC101457718 isoform X2 [Ceratitis capitata]|uniref:uncharacterized protein LOC101457718 isoform X2 n=1 Tax=Ceratitis capitata TaxID=7213 RepID=UPI000329AB7D|nr:uncharacterized protein LOC101457718 isoform X2 [Ceratitis capitata]
MDALILRFDMFDLIDEKITYVRMFIAELNEKDLQLAAELGKTLLERNKELETLVKELKGTIDEQQQEIVYLKKHANALREVNDTRLKVYEQLDLGIQDMERSNHRLTAENNSDKKHIKTLVQTIEALEARQEELNKQIDELRQSLTMERRKNERLSSANERRNTAANESSRSSNGVLNSVAVKESSSTNKGNDSGSERGYEPSTTAPENCSFEFGTSAQPESKANSTSIGVNQSNENSMGLSDLVCNADDSEEIIKLVNDLEMMKKAFLAEQQRCTELEEQLVAIIQENQMLQSRLASNSPNEEMRSMQEELSVLDEVREGKMCSRCMRVLDDPDTIGDEQLSLAPTDDYQDEERSLLDNASECSQAIYRPGVSIKVAQRIADSLDLNMPSSSPNPYRELVEKYEALLEVQCSAIVRKNTSSGGGDGMSLADEFQSSGEFSQSQKSHTPSSVARENMNTVDDGGAVGGDSTANGSAQNGGDASLTLSQDADNSAGKVGNESAKDLRGRTPTEYSETGTTSSGYADETSNKCTQTENRPGSFLCTIGDGEMCKFSIYDDASPIDSHFRNRPEYKELFKEIFAVLKKAATNKEEGEKLPLLDDTEPAAAAACTAIAKVPPVTPANEELPIDFGDDAQSIISSAVSEQSFAMSECITKLERKTAKKHIIEKNQENQPPMHVGASITTVVVAGQSPIVENGRVLTPLKREPLEYLSVGVGIKKKNRRKNRNFGNDRPESPAVLPSPPRFFIASGKKRRDVRPYVQSPLASTTSTAAEQPRSSRSTGGARYEWNGSSMVIYNRSLNSPGTPATSLHGREMDFSNLEYRPSFLSMELNQLKNLEKSYAEVLRTADSCKHDHCRSASHHHHHHHHHHQQQQLQQQKQHKQQKQQRNRKT